jgi:hypothetical protein
MKELPRPDEVPLTVAALRIRESYSATRTMMLQGDLRGRLVGNRWYVDGDDVARLEAGRIERDGAERIAAERSAQVATSA